jgi:hypothetical protein
MEKNLPRTFITCDGYDFELNTIGKLTEAEFLNGKPGIKGFKDLPNFNAKNAWKQVQKAYQKLIRENS